MIKGSVDEKQQLLSLLRRRHGVVLAFLAGWVVFSGILMTAVSPRMVYLVLIAFFLPFMLGLLIYEISERDYGKFVIRRYAPLADWLLRSDKSSTRRH